MCSCFLTDVVRNNIIERSVFFQLCESSVDSFCQLGFVLGNCDGVLFKSKILVKDLKTFIRLDKFLCRLVIDDYTVNFALHQCHDSLCAFGETFDLCSRFVSLKICHVDVAGGSHLNADRRTFKIIYRLHCRKSAGMHCQSHGCAKSECCCSFHHLHHTFLLDFRIKMQIR